MYAVFFLLFIFRFFVFAVFFCCVCCLSLRRKKKFCFESESSRLYGVPLTIPSILLLLFLHIYYRLTFDFLINSLFCGYFDDVFKTNRVAYYITFCFLCVQTFLMFGSGKKLQF